MASSHLKRIVAPKTWPIVRKTTTYISRPKPCGTKMQLTLPVVVIMRDMLGLVQTAKQTRSILRTESVTVNGRRVHDTDSAVGFMDILTVGGKSYRVLLNENNKLYLVHASEQFTIQKIIDKTSVGKGKTQVNCASGINLLVAKDAYKTGDSIVLSADGKQQVMDTYPLAAGACVLLTGGNHIGKIGIVERIEGKTIAIKADGKTLETATTHAYVIGKDKPTIKITE